LKIPTKKQIATIVLLLLWALFVNPPAVKAKEVEIAYDDSDYEAKYWWELTGPTIPEGHMVAVLFTAPDTPFKLLEASFNIEEPDRFRIRVFDSNRRPLPIQQIVEPTTDGWIRVDLRQFNMELEGDFYIALEYLVSGRPQLLGDTSDPKGRSFWVSPSRGWEAVAEVARTENNPLFNTNFAIRATIALPHRVILDIQPAKIPEATNSVIIDGESFDQSRFPIQFKWIQGSVHTIAINSPIIMTAPGERFVFDSWSDGSKDASRSITVSEDMILTAIYKKQYLLTIESEFGRVEGAGWYDEGSKATISLSTPEIEVGPGVRMFFERWTGDVSSSDKVTSIIMNSPKKITATWKRQYLLTVDPNGGTVAGEGWYDEGTLASVSAISPSGVVEGQSRLVFVGWSGDISSTSSQITIPMNRPYHISANWKTQFYLTIDPGQGEVDQTSQWVDAGATVTITAKSPSKVEERRSMLVFTGWDGSVVSPGQTVTITMDTYKTIIARWKAQYYLKVVSELGNPRGEGWYDAGSTAFFSVTTPLGFLIQDVFEGWTGDSQTRSASGYVIMDSPKVVIAQWRKDYTPLLLLAAVLISTVSAGAIIMGKRRRPFVKEYYHTSPKESDEQLRRAKLMELERLKAEGKISEEAYNRLREEFERDKS
jgi:hypothetical protein